MDPNIQTILLGLLTNGLTAFIAQFGRKDSKLLLGEELLKKMKWEETALQPILQGAAYDVAEKIEWQGIPSLEIVCLFLTSPEAESIVRQIYATQLATTESGRDFKSIRKEFLTSFYLYITAYSSYAQLKENQLTEASNFLFDTLLAGCGQTLNAAIDEGKLSAHEAQSAFRHRLILEELTAIQENVNFLTSQKKPNVKDVLAFEETYRRLVGNRHKNITPPNFGKVRQIHINKLYVSPNFVTSSKEHNEKPELFVSVVHKNSTNSYRTVLSGTFRAVLLGNPGGGKSTLAQKLCYDLVTHYSGRIFGGRRYITPIMVILRDYGSEKKNHNCSILEFIQMKAKTDYQLQPPPGAFEYLFLNGRALVIFDGLDELLDTRDRQEISRAVEAFCTLYPSVPVLVTSREVGYEQAPLDEEAFEIFRLASFNEDQVQEYARKWFDVITDIPVEQRKQKAESFLKESQMVPDLRNNPLMLALLCNIYQEEHYIPTNRPDIYEKCANMLFERWDRSRGINVNLPFDIHLRPTMTYLAYWIYSDERLRGGVTEEHLLVKTTEYLRQKLLEDEAQKVAREFIEFCKGRAWVFTNMGSTKYGEELYQFTHQTFLEYFTAVYLCRINSTPAKLLNVLRSRIVKREWDIVAQLAFQKQTRDIEDAGNFLLSALIKQAQTAKDEKWNLLSFAVRCLEFIIPSPHVMRDIVSTCIKQSLAWGIEHSKKIPSANKLDSPLPEDIFTYLLNAAPDNRRIIAIHLEDLFMTYAKSTNDLERILVLEIGTNLTILYNKLHEDPKTKPTPLQVNVGKFWQNLSDRLIEAYSEELKVLCQKHLPLCYKVLMERKIGLTEIIKWHGVASIFLHNRYIMLPSMTWVSDAGQILANCSDLTTTVPRKKYYLNQIKQAGSLLLSTPLPWIKGDLLIDFSMYGLNPYLEYQPQNKNTPKQLDFDTDALFGFFVLSSILVECYQKRDQPYFWSGAGGYRGASSIEISQAIKSAKHPVFKFIRWMLLARYETLEFDLDNTSSIINRVQAEMDRCNFTTEQRNFIWRWIRREVELIQKI